MSAQTIPSQQRTSDLDRLIAAAGEVAVAGGADQIGPEHILLALLREPILVPTSELREMGLDAGKVLAQIARYAEREVELIANREGTA